jgi:hypothetical protein
MLRLRSAIRDGVMCGMSNYNPTVHGLQVHAGITLAAPSEARIATLTPKQIQDVIIYEQDTALKREQEILEALVDAYVSALTRPSIDEADAVQQARDFLVRHLSYMKVTLTYRP